HQFCPDCHHDCHKLHEYGSDPGHDLFLSCASQRHTHNNLSGYSGTASATTADTIAPSAPSNLTATAPSSAQINLTWTASTDNVGVTGYRLERCQGAGCSTFAQIATPASTSFSDTGLTRNTSYSYRVSATDAAGNLSGYSNTAKARTRSQ